jgi:hypothetical protein
VPRGASRFGVNVAGVPPLKRSDNPVSFDRDPNSFSLHFQKGISEVRLEFLANPDYRMLEVSHEGDEFVDRSDQLLLWCGRPFLQKVIQHVDHD